MSPVIRFCLDLFRRCEIRLALERIYIIAKLLDPFIPLYPDLDFVFFFSSICFSFFRYTVGRSSSTLLDVHRLPLLYALYRFH